MVKRVIGDDEEWFEEEEPPLDSPGRTVLVEGPRNPVFTGILDEFGNPIYRAFYPKPPMGFRSHPDTEHLFDFDPDEDTYYITGTVQEEESEE